MRYAAGSATLGRAVRLAPPDPAREVPAAAFIPNELPPRRCSGLRRRSRRRARDCRDGPRPSRRFHCCPSCRRRALPGCWRPCSSPRAGRRRGRSRGRAGRCVLHDRARQGARDATHGRHGRRLARSRSGVRDARRGVDLRRDGTRVGRAAHGDGERVRGLGPAGIRARGAASRRARS